MSNYLNDSQQLAHFGPSFTLGSQPNLVPTSIVEGYQPIKNIFFNQQVTLFPPP